MDPQLKPYSISLEITFLQIFSATSWCSSISEKDIISLLELPSEMELSL